ncbi:MAG TPA: twin-arginine translocase TatA/TatE family subunit, partial [Vulgatibacter sp.]
MFGLSFPELIIVLVIALLVLGPERLPKVAKTIGKTMRDVRRTTSEFKDMVEGEFHAIEQSVEGKPEREGGAPEGVAAGHTGAGIPAAPSGAPALRPAGALPAAGIAMHRLDEAAQAEDPSPLHAHAAFAGEAGASPDRSAAGASAG